MAPVHLYLAAWVLGGVLLGASMLLDARALEPPDQAPESRDPAAPSAGREPSLLAAGGLPGATALGRARRRFLSSLRLMPLGLIGFGLSGLLAKGLDLDLWPWTFVSALSIGLSLIALGYRLSRARLQ